MVFLCIQGNVIPGTTHSECKRKSADTMYKIQMSCVLEFRSIFLDILQVSGCFKPTLAFKQAGMGTEISCREDGNQMLILRIIIFIQDTNLAVLLYVHSKVTYHNV